ncbi:pre-mRNA 3'-end-processing factor FIP1-like [Zootermopsis nevadensis]|uniref:pre-mRNA 3'-end-processing factor FIP1-like n=1 Tax=Zootermopsis nevadensis TaxID=136037 RepID=UPI000B8E6D62|nr:pre-mRNA 3'-end-processing factor FIP1-like [Zootermopsis nevadensis]
MAEDCCNEDQWLYGDSNPEPPEIETKNEQKAEATDETTAEVTQQDENTGESDQLPVPEPPTIPPPSEHEDDQLSRGEEQLQAPARKEAGVEETANENGDGDDDEDEDEEDSDDDVQVVIGDIKTSPTYTSLNIKRGGLLTSAVGGEKLKQPGKFSIEEFEAVGTINGVPAHEFNLDSLEDKPWRKPGADITDYFNYGFNEETWRAYCERQKRIRIHESGVGLAQIGGQTAGRGTIPVAITNDNSKYSGFMGPKKAGPPPGRKMGGTIDVIGGGGLASRRNLEKGTPPKENIIQVMTADRREYSRKPAFPDMSVPPPTSGIPPFDLPPPPHGVVPPTFPPHMDSYGSEFYASETDPYYHSYEPTQDSQWNDPTWQSTAMLVTSADVKVITPGPLVTPLPPVIPPPTKSNDAETANQDSQDEFSSRGSGREHSDDIAASGATGSNVGSGILVPYHDYCLRAGPSYIF